MARPSQLILLYSSTPVHLDRSFLALLSLFTKPTLIHGTSPSRHPHPRGPPREKDYSGAVASTSLYLLSRAMFITFTTSSTGTVRSQ